MPFDIPVTFTIAPHDPNTDAEGFLRYASRMNGLTEAEFHTILTGVIHGQTRILAGTAASLFFAKASLPALHACPAACHCRGEAGASLTPRCSTQTFHATHEAAAALPT